MESYPLQINVLGINDVMFEIEEPVDFGSKGDINTDGDIMEQDQSTGDITESTTTPDTAQFKGVIDSIDGDEAIVTPDEGEDIRRSGDAVTVYIADYMSLLITLCIVAIGTDMPNAKGLPSSSVRGVKLLECSNHSIIGTDIHDK